MEIFIILLEIWLRHRAKIRVDVYIINTMRSFSWLRMLVAVLYGFGQPLLLAYILYRQAVNTSFTTLISIFLLTPKAFSIVAFLSCIGLSKGYGTQLLIVDSVVTLYGWATLQPANTNVFQPWVPYSPPAGPGLPSRVALAFKGLYLATFPGAFFAFVYTIFWLAILGLIVIAIWTKDRGPAKLAGVLFSIWLVFVFLIVSTPIFALWEACWILYAKARKRGDDNAVFSLSSGNTAYMVLL
ncbi:hypothetical protein BDY21DRAFT_424277 [Lineolata rhizophorae]|uniref:Uncharacterized protein n=1 Tax=Lineolata rhizophorae TaxID=578093 RepID=A0A6A6NP84_9PEZI|nr:hypothetical protein BDY21DRAFT_424277 [Lineolata rhizophorae]